MTRADPPAATAAAGPAGPAAVSADVSAGVSARRSRVGPRLLGALAAAVVLAATFALYLRPGLTLDLGAFLAFCGVRRAARGRARRGPAPPAPRRAR